MRNFITLCVFLFAVSLYGQNNFKSGYFITNEGRRVNCLIKHSNLQKAPLSFEYKLDEISEVQEGDIAEVQEFSISDKMKFKRFEVQMDMSSDDEANLSTEKEPQFETLTVYLRELVDGKADLYMYDNGDITRFFFLTETRGIEQLIFKKYFYHSSPNPSNNNKVVAVNDRFKQQLRSYLTCNNMDDASLIGISYDEKALSKFFLKYNKCVNPKFDYQPYYSNEIELSVSVRPGITKNSVMIDYTRNSMNYRNANFDPQLNFTFGVEGEAVLPGLRNHLAITLEAAYQSYKSTIDLARYDADITYKSVNIGLGVRGLLYINPRNKIFINTGLLVGMGLDPELNYESHHPVELSGLSPTLYYGAGYKFAEKISLEFRYQSPGSLTRNFVGIDSEYNATSLILGYTL